MMTPEIEHDLTLVGLLQAIKDAGYPRLTVQEIFGLRAPKYQIPDPDAKVEIESDSISDKDWKLFARLTKKYGKEKAHSAIDSVSPRGPGRRRISETTKDAEGLNLVEYVEEQREEYEVEGHSAPLKRAIEDLAEATGWFIETATTYYNRAAKRFLKRVQRERALTKQMEKRRAAYFRKLRRRQDSYSTQ